VAVGAGFAVDQAGVGAELWVQARPRLPVTALSAGGDGRAVQTEVGVEAHLVDADVGGSEVQVPSPRLAGAAGEVRGLGQVAADLLSTGVPGSLPVLGQ